MVPPALWGITLPEVKDFREWVRGHPVFKKAKQAGKRMSVREMVDTVLKASGPLDNGYPETFATSTRRSVALNKNSPRPIRWLVSHCWEEDFEQFFEDLISLLGDKMKVSNDEGIFVCFLCMFQGDDEDIEMQVTQGSENIFKGCFAEILQSVKAAKGALCVVPNENLRAKGQGIYSRLWCGWEAAQAKKNRVHILLHPDRNKPDYLFDGGDMTMSLCQGSCGPPGSENKIDKDNAKRIRSAIDHNWEAIDQTLKLICELQSSV